MEFQTLKRSHLKRNIIIGVVCIAIISAVVLNFTRAKYRTTQSIPLVNGTINYELSDLNLIGVYIEDGNDYTRVDQIPDSGYTFNSEKSYCKIGDEKQDMTITYDMNAKNLTIAPMTKKGTKCYLYFDKKTTLKDTILANNSVNSGTPNFANTATTDEGVYKTQDDWGDSYYFRGAVNNNWVKFANFYWRIIRINGDGSIRMIYQGTSANTTGTGTQLQTNAFNSSYNRSEYVGYMYTSGQQHGNTTNSPIKTIIDNWYSSNLASYADKISKEAGFCGDREMASGYSWSSQPSSTIYYAGYGRLVANSSSVNPTFKCSNSNDLYTTSSSSKGNKKLTNPIGLITADEVIMAGGAWNSGNSSYYLYNNANYWTMSPYDFIASSSRAYVFYVSSDGILSWHRVNSAAPGVRPVINLSADVKVTGSGTSSDPFVVS